MEVINSDNIFQKFMSLFIPISKSLRDEFYSIIVKENFTRVIIISIIYILFEINIMNTKIGIHIYISIIMIIFHIISILISFWLMSKKHINGMITQVFIDLYCAVLIYWSVSISLGQVQKTGSITMFILTLTGTSALFYRRTLIALITNLGFYIYFVINIKLLEKTPFVSGLINLPIGNPPVGRLPIGKPQSGIFPQGNLPAGSPSNILSDVHLYISDAFLMTSICCVLAIIVYRLRLKVFLDQKTLEELALKDSMTSLFNHKAICNLLEMEIKRLKRSSQPFSIFMTDIDHFKHINDTYGHQIGDKVIIKIAKLLTKFCRETDYVGRYGGEEFLVVLTNTSEDGAKKFGEQFRKEVEKMNFELQSQVTVSGGVKTYENESSAEEMIKLADGALYQAKEKGRNCIICA